MLALVWKLIKLWGGRLVTLFYKLVKAQIRALLWKYGIMAVLIVLTVALAYLVLR
jgi:hypothetical protein